MATRFYLPSSGAAAVSPSYSASWEDTSSAIRLKAVTTKIASAMTTDSFTDADPSNKDILHVQYVSDPIAAQTIAAQSVKIQIRATETRSGNNLFVSWRVYVVSGDGATERGTIVAHQRDGSEVINVLTNRGDSATSSAVVASAGDRIVIEVGRGGDPSAAADNHSGTISIGDDSGTDLPEDNTTTAAYNPWVEFANTIDWPSSATYTLTADAGSFALTGQDAGLYANRVMTADAGSFTLTGKDAAFAVGTLANYKIGYGGDVDTIEDTLINVLNPDWTGWTHGSFEIIGGAQVQKGLIRFIAADIDPAAKCVSAVATFTKNDAADGAYTPTVTFYPIAAANGSWTGTTTATPAPAGDCVWDGLEADGSGGVTTAWAGSAGLSTAGTDYTSAPAGSVVAGSGDAVGTTYAVNIDNEVVTPWFGGATNNGLVFWGDAPGGHWSQKDYATASYRPYLDLVILEPIVAGATYTLTADAGSFTLTGQDAALVASHKLTADVGTFTLTGIDAGLYAGRKLTADVGAFTLSGIDAGLYANRLLTADVGEFVLTGQDTDLLARRVLTADVGTFTLTGQDVTLTYSGAGGPTYTLTADVGTFALMGQDALLLARRVLAADAGTYTLTGQDAGLIASHKLTADVGAFVLAGQDAGIYANRVIVATAGAFTLTGIDAGLYARRVLTADTGAFVLTGQDVDFTHTLIYTAIIALTLPARSTTLTLEARDVALTLLTRSLGLTLEDRDTSLTILARSTALTVEDK